ncbi:MAG TPA: DUF4097 family beta strand repeat-containing protein [Candidatus Acidoferrales bacterium]|nr:DUF4097 family beta strand repeat-containing protein [Candidatus Acidoferrales bacterium]
MKRRFGLALAVALGAAMIASAARADEWSKRYSVSGKPDLALTVDNGAVNITAGNSGEVTVRVVTTGWRIPDDLRITESQSGNHVMVEARETHRWMEMRHGSVNVEVSVPSETDLNVHTGNGSVMVAPVRGQERIQTGNGHIEANGLQGELWLHTGNGHINGSGLGGTLDAGTGNGGIVVTGRFDSLTVACGHGQVEATALDGSRLTSLWDIHSGVGGITLRLPSNISADLEGSTGVGKLSIDFPVTVSGSLTGSSVRGRIGNGGALLRVHTGVGSVHIERAGA